MKPLENRRWYLFLTLALSLALMFGVWTVVSLPVNLRTSTVYLFSTLGIWSAVNRFFALALIKIRPEMGQVA